MHSKRRGQCNYTLPQLLKNYPALVVTDYMNAESQADEHCSKIFVLKDTTTPNTRCMLPSHDDLYTHNHWQVPKLQELKRELNGVKSKLDGVDIDKWHQHTHQSNPAHKVTFSVRSRAKPELLTQAFLKFYEILHSFSIVPREGPRPAGVESPFKSLHLCEAPGAFVVALNHYLVLHYPDIEWKWLGNTLNPYFEGFPPSECVSDDRLILFTLKNWFFGEDETGNLMNLPYLQQLIEHIGGQGNMDLVTADGSVDCQETPDEQEIMTHSLHFCEVISALSTLKQGGAFVLKMFTAFETESVNLIYLISCCFSEVYVYKPTTSKLGNSEVYVVALGFNAPINLGLVLSKLYGTYGNAPPDKVMFGSDNIPAWFINRIVKCSEFFKRHQINAIERNIFLFNPKTPKDSQYLELLKTLVLSRFLDNNYCVPIHPSRKIVKENHEIDEDMLPFESYSTRWGKHIMKKPKDQRIKFLSDQYNNIARFYSSTFIKDDSSDINYQSYEYSQQDSLKFVEIKKGKPFHFIQGSKFCHSNLLHIYSHFVRECASEDQFDSIQLSHCKELDPCEESETYKNIIEQTTKNCMEEIKRRHPNALIIDEGVYASPHSCLKAFSELLASVQEGKLADGSDVVLINCPLLTRSQTGILTILGMLFEKIIFYEPAKTLISTPFLAMVNFISIDKGQSTLNLLTNHGCSFNKESPNIPNQLLSLQYLLQSPTFRSVCRYNAFYCLNKILCLKGLFEDLFK